MGKRATAAQAAEIRHGVFCGVQHHPEIGLEEVAGAPRRQADDLVEAGSARTSREVEDHAVLAEAPHREPGRRDPAWRLGQDDKVTDDGVRRTGMRNFIATLAVPGRGERR